MYLYLNQSFSWIILTNSIIYYVFVFRNNFYSHNFYITDSVIVLKKMMELFMSLILQNNFSHFNKISYHYCCHFFLFIMLINLSLHLIFEKTNLAGTFLFN